ncbi:MAG: flagellar basal body rod protein FlgC [Planctomycetes bacterium]|nr:flagellar basal body rod protein FlgC [Planctomycetota bacterium]
MSDGPFPSLDVSASALAAERLRMNVIATNIANANVVNTPEGGPYKKRVVLFEPIFNDIARGLKPAPTLGVRARVDVDKTPGERVHDPSNPYADPQGYVEHSNVKPMFEMVDLMLSARSYEANLSAMKAYREMVMRTIQMGR